MIESDKDMGDVEIEHQMQEDTKTGKLGPEFYTDIGPDPAMSDEDYIADKTLDSDNS